MYRPRRKFPLKELKNHDKRPRAVLFYLCIFAAAFVVGFLLNMVRGPL